MLLMPAAFLDVFEKQIDQAQSSIYLQSLTLEVGQVMDQLSPALIRAAQRGVEVVLHVDWIAQEYVHGKVSLTPRLRPADRRYARELHQKNHQLVEQLKAAGVTVRYVNQPDWLAKVLPIAGRNHIKLYMVDEKVVWVGGVNLLDLALKHLDFMVAYENPALITELKRIFFSPQLRDESFSFTPESELLVDGGQRGKSIIYREALELVEQAQTSIVFMSQFVPEGAVLSALLQKAREGCQIKVFTSPTSTMQFSQWPYKFTYVHCQRALKSVGCQVEHLPQKVHCKLLLVDGTAAIFGSHNLIETGVRLGTSEIAIKTTAADILAELIAFVRPFHVFQSPLH